MAAVDPPDATDPTLSGGPPLDDEGSDSGQDVPVAEEPKRERRPSGALQSLRAIVKGASGDADLPGEAGVDRAEAPTASSPTGPVDKPPTQSSEESSASVDRSPGPTERSTTEPNLEIEVVPLSPQAGGSADSGKPIAGVDPVQDDDTEPSPETSRFASRDMEVEGEPPAIGDPGLAGTVRSTMPLASSGRSDVAADGYEIAEGLSVVAASVRGRAHRASETPRQDDYAIRLSLDRSWLVCSVADGVSGGAMSHVAARIAAHQGAGLILEALESGAEAEFEDTGGSSEDPTTILSSVDFGPVFKRVSESILGAAQKHSGTDATAPELARLMSTAVTYVVIATTPHDGVLHGVFSSVGDCSVWLLDGSSWRSLSGLKHASGESSAGGPSSDRVTALPYYPAAPVAQSFTVPLGQMCMILSDGIGDPLYDGLGDVGETLAKWWHRRPSPQSLAWQADFRRKSYDDDRTVVGIWTEGVG